MSSSTTMMATAALAATAALTLGDEPRLFAAEAPAEAEPRTQQVNIIDYALAWTMRHYRDGECMGKAIERPTVAFVETAFVVEGDDGGGVLVQYVQWTPAGQGFFIVGAALASHHPDYIASVFVHETAHHLQVYCAGFDSILEATSQEDMHHRACLMEADAYRVQGEFLKYLGHDMDGQHPAVFAYNSANFAHLLACMSHPRGF